MNVPGVERMAWPDFYRRFRRRVKAGEHGVIIGSTGSGKSVLAARIVPLFGKNVVIVDGKGGDDPSLDIPGFEVIRKWPPGAELEVGRSLFPQRDHEPIRVRLAPRLRKHEDHATMRAEFDKALRDLFTRKGSKVYALYVDEMQIVADPREGMGLGHLIGPLLRTKRYHGMSVVTATQYPTWIPKSSYRESTHRFLFPIQDEESSYRLGQISGQRKTLVPILDGLRPFEFVYQHVRDARAFVVSKVDLKG